MKGTTYWYGLEVEGRFTDIKTVFIRSEVPDDVNDFPHVFFTLEFVKDSIKKNNWDVILKILDKSKKFVTIEADESTLDDIPHRIYNHVHIIYRVQIPKNHINKLKKFDSVSLDNGMYNTFVISKNHLQHVTPDEYKFDTL